MAENNMEYSTDGVIYISLEEGLKRVMNNKKLYLKLLNKFKTDTNLDGLLSAIKAQDYDKAQGAAHTVKGIAANLSFLELYKQAQEVETQIKSKSVNPGTLDSFTLCYNETLKHIDKVITDG